MRKGRPNRHTVDTGAKNTGIGSNKAVLQHDPLIKFSFKYLHMGHEKFKYDDQDAQYFLKLIERMQGLSFFKVSELQVSRSKSLRFHDNDWSRTTEDCFGLPNEEELVDKPWQFEISSIEHGRVHGFFIGNVFYIVWFDPKHLLCS